MHILGPLVLLDLITFILWWHVFVICSPSIGHVGSLNGFDIYQNDMSHQCHRSMPGFVFLLFVCALALASHPPWFILCAPKNNSVTAPDEREEKTHRGAYFPLPAQREITKYTSRRALLSAVINRSGQISAGQLKQYYVIILALFDFFQLLYVCLK